MFAVTAAGRTEENTIYSSDPLTSCLNALRSCLIILSLAGTLYVSTWQTSGQWSVGYAKLGSLLVVSQRLTHLPMGWLQLAYWALHSSQKGVTNDYYPYFFLN